MGARVRKGLEFPARGLEVAFGAARPEHDGADQVAPVSRRGPSEGRAVHWFTYLTVSI